MKKLIKKRWCLIAIIAAVLAVTLVCAIACSKSCHGNEDATAETPMPTEETTTEPTAESTPQPTETAEPTPTSTLLPEGWITDPNIPEDVEIAALGDSPYDNVSTCICKEEGKFYYREYTEGAISYSHEVPEEIVGTLQTEENMTMGLFLVTETETGYNVFYYKKDVGKKLCVTDAKEVVHHNLCVYALMDDHTLIMYDFYRDYYFLYTNEDVVIRIIQNDIGEVYFMVGEEWLGNVDIIEEAAEHPLD